MLEPNTTTPCFSKKKKNTTTPPFTTTAANGASFKRSKPPPPPLTVPPGHNLFRLVCHHSRICGVIGKSGAIIKQLQQETVAKIRIEDPAPGSEERVIVVIGSSAVNRKLALKLSSEKGPESSGVNYELTDVSAAQEALVRVFERALHVAAETDLVSCRLLAEVNQAGSVIGKGGKVVEKIRKDTGCRIRVLSPEKSPAYASPNDETVEIEGDVLAVKRALVAVSFRLQDFQPIDKIQVSGSRPVESNSQETPHNLSVDLPSQRSVVLPTVPASSAASASGGLHIPVEADSNHAMELNRNQKEVIFRILCPCQRVGSVIGRGGTIVKALENESGASISIGAPVPECEERLITITAMEDTELRYSPAQNAAVLVFCRLIDAGVEKSPQSGSSNRSTVSARLLVPSNQVGCLLGKGGAIVSNIRKTTGTGIRIIGDDQVPKCASESDKVVQIEGDVLAVKRALVAVSFRLRDFQPIDKIQVSGNRPVESNSQETPHNLSVDLPSQRSVVLPTVPASSVASASGGLHIPVEADSNHAMELNRNQKEVIFRILCPSQRVGSVIGRGGTIVKALENESGASISIGAPVPECEERLITITAMEDTELRYSPVQNAAVLVFCRLMDAGVEKSPQSGSSNRSTVSARLLVPSNQVGCLLGKGGAIVSNIRKTTGTGIRIIGDDQVPKCASESDKVVQIEGDVLAVKRALVAVSFRLQDFQPIDKIQVSGSRPVESNSQETPHNLSVDLPSQRSVLLPTVPASSAASASGGLHIPVEADSNHAMELNRNQKEVIFRILCPCQRVGSVIGRGGTIVKALENESGASISIGAPVPECEERLITITAMEDTELRYSPAQNAAVLVFCRLIDSGVEKSPQSGSSNRSTVSARLLVPSNQVGCLLGKGGAIVSNIRKTTGTGIRIIGDDQVPKCASESDKVVQIEGDVLAVKRALMAVSFRLRDFQHIDKSQVSGSRPVESNSQETPHNLSVDLPSQRSVVLPTVPASSATSASGVLHFPVEADSNHAMELNRNLKEVIFRILCPSQRAGSVIGRGGTIVKALQNESGASISFGAPVPECEERLITITAMEDTELRYSPAQNAAVLVFCRLIDAGVEKSPQSGSSNRSTVSARLLVPSNQVGCLLKKGGAIVSNIRKTTGTGIRIIGDDQVPKCASESDKVVQITGEIVNVEDAIFNVTGKLRENLFPRKLPDATGLRNISPMGNQSSPYNPESTRTSVGLYSGVPHNFNRPTALTQSHGHFGLSHTYDTPPSSESWSSQTIAGSRPRSTVDLGRGPASGRGGPQIGSENRPLVTNTTVEISVPESDVGAVYGENGSNLTRLRLISGAKVTVHEPRSGTTDRTVIISGTPDETQAAQSLLHAFILAGS